LDPTYAGRGYVMDMRMNFFKEPRGFLNIDHLLERADEIAGDREFTRIDIIFDRYVKTMWSGDIWDRISEDAERLGVNQA